MNTLRYIGFSPGSLNTKVKKVVKSLEAGDFAAADVKKMPNVDFYRAKLDKTNRLLFKIAKHKEEKYLLLLEVIPNHDYDKSRFLRGAEIKEDHFEEIPSAADIEEDKLEVLPYVNTKKSQFHLLGKVISWDDIQQEVFGLPLPLVVIGSAGSGKTALTLEKMKFLQGNIAYISLSQYLVDNAQKQYYSFNFENEKQEVSFMSFQEFVESISLPEGREIKFKDFERWYSRYKQTYKFKNAHKVFEEFKGVLTGSTLEAPYLSRAEYLDLGIKQSIFLEKEREKVYELFEKYLTFLEESQLYDLNMVAQQLFTKVEPTYDYVVVDEVQDLTNVQLNLILRALQVPTNFLLSGDSNQIVHPNFFSWSKLKTMLYHSEVESSLMRVLTTNYRNSNAVNALSNTLLRIKNARFGSIDKESTYLIDTVSEKAGEVSLYKDDKKIKRKLNDLTRNSTKFAILVMNNEDKPKARKFFKTPLVFSIQEAKGLEYPNVIMLNFISDYDKFFDEVCRDIEKADLEGELVYGRAKDKSNKELEAYKFYVNSLYVAFTRAIENIYMIESVQKHRLLNLLDLVEIKQSQKEVTIERQDSDDDEWLREAENLEAQGKFEQAEQIRAQIKGVPFISHEEAEELKPLALDSANPNKMAQKKLLKYIKLHTDIDLLDQLANINCNPAIKYRRELRQELRDYVEAIEKSDLDKVKEYIRKFHVDVPDMDNRMSGLFHSITQGNLAAFRVFIDKNASITQQSPAGDPPLQHLLRQIGEKKERNKPMVISAKDKKLLRRMYPSLTMPYIKCKTSNRIIKISNRTMEFFLIHSILAFGEFYIPDDALKTKQGLFIKEFLEYIEQMPDEVLPPYRKKRQYINAVLANNEIDRDFKYNKKLFKRKSRGCYHLNPELEIRYS